MALFLPGPLVGQISGRIGGTIFSRNRGGQYIRNGSLPVVPYSLKASMMKSALQAASARWLQIEQDKTLGWDAWAATHPVQNKLGQQALLTGQQWFIRLNSRLIFIQTTMNDDAPTTEAPENPLYVIPTVTAPGTATITFSPSPVTGNLYFWVRGAKASSPRRNYMRNKLTSLMPEAEGLGSSPILQGTSPIALGTSLVDTLGPIEEGEKYFFEFRIIDTATGLTSSPIYVNTVAEPAP